MLNFKTFIKEDDEAIKRAAYNKAKKDGKDWSKISDTMKQSYINMAKRNNIARGYSSSYPQNKDKEKKVDWNPKVTGRYVHRKLGKGSIMVDPFKENKK
jgi:hypothetical protein